ncbi:4a-hydroxytetrahydrobiopterin dehydratase [Teredinibacter franksiae]|uniref:4a-hydroxytetrahydrobiopterin dehydratase n=1 Tax=Teredinibacter franksiae TaxID=2761453 RepID=UPI0016288476|nr:4a-hydroxytetrahydrobiopterin dehydratase [Teredinibacter franksiae]
MTNFSDPLFQADRLSQTHCEACRADAPPLSQHELEALPSQLPRWTIIEDSDVAQLKQVFAFSNFVQALAFANRVGELAEEEGHHPALLVEWGRVTARWWTHKIRGLHKNDVIMAAKTDHLYANEPIS